jgi:GT2 family glycosyltransferase
MSPVAIFTYNRPDHLRKCIQSLKKNLLFKKTKFFIFQDGLKSYSSSITAKYESLFSELPGNFKIIKRKKNYGLKRNIMSGVSYILSKYRTVIVCEDDLVFHRDFIYYMNYILSTSNSTTYLTRYHIFSSKKTLQICTFFFYISVNDDIVD